MNQRYSINYGVRDLQRCAFHLRISGFNAIIYGRKDGLQRGIQMTQYMQYISIGLLAVNVILLLIILLRKPKTDALTQAVKTELDSNNDELREDIVSSVCRPRPVLSSFHSFLSVI